MDKKLLTVIVIIIVLIGGGLVYLVSQDEPAANQTPNTSASNEPETAPADDTGNTETTGRYIEYGEAQLVATEGTKILFFYAPWCPQCRALEASISESAVPSGVTIFKVDYDTNQKLRQKYGVTIQTTLVKVDDSGNLVEKYVAYDEPNFEAVKENLL